MNTIDENVIGSLRESLWHGQIPVMFTIHPTEVTTLHAPRPYYALIPRMSYLICHTRQVIEYFRDVAPPINLLNQSSSIWFANQENEPLKWHLPFGLLYDLMHQTSAKSENRTTNAMLPWKIIVRFQSFPTEKLLPLENEKSVESHFMHTLKQAMFLRTGSTKVIMSMPEAQQNQIWTSLIQHDYRQYIEATQAIFAPLATISSVNHRDLRLIPIRLHFPTEPYIQLRISPFEPMTEEKEEEPISSIKTVENILLSCLTDSISVQKIKVIAHGINLPLNVSIVEVYRAFMYPDGFLHLSISS